MSNYTKSTNFATKDNLSSGNPLKIVKGTEIDTEFNNIQTAVATKADLSSPTFTGSPVLPTGTTGVTQSTNDSSTKLATTAFVQAVSQVLFPIGAIYTATVSTNPATLLGFGTWTAFGAGRVLIGNGGGFTAGTTGGSADAILVSHNHTTTSAGNHQHFTHTSATATASGVGSSDVTSGNYFVSQTSGGTDWAYATRATASAADVGLTSTAGAHTHTISTEGSSGTNANLQPYVVVYMWQRTA